MNVMPFLHVPLTTRRIEVKRRVKKGRVSDGAGLRVKAARSHHGFTARRFCRQPPQRQFPTCPKDART